MNITTYGSTNPHDYSPPGDWSQFYVTFVGRPGVPRSQKRISSLTRAELGWLTRCVTAELERREQAGRKEKERRTA